MSESIFPKYEDRVIPRNVSMYPEQWAAVEEINERFEFRNTSTALRYIVNEYRRLKDFEAIMRHEDLQ